MTSSSISRKILIFVSLLGLSSLCFAASPDFQIATSPSSLTFTGTVGGSPVKASLLLDVGRDNAFQASVSTTTGGSWLSVSPASGTSGGTLTVTATPGILTAGTYQGTVTITSTGASNSPLKVNASFVIGTSTTGSTKIATSPSSLSFTATAGGSAVSQSLAVDVGGSIYTAVASTSGGGSWLSVRSATSTGGPLTVTATPGTLAAGSYQGSVTITASGASNSPLTVPVTLVISSTDKSFQIAASPSSLTLTAAPGGSSVALPLLVDVGRNNTFQASVATNSGGNWLSVTPTSGTSGGALMVSGAPGSLAAGSYQGTITITATGASNSPFKVPVTLVLAVPKILTSPTQLSFQITPSGAPQTQVLAVSVAPGISFQASVKTTTGGNWLSLIPTTTTSTIGSQSGGSVSTTVSLAGVGGFKVTASPGTLAAGSYSGAVVLTASGASNSPLSVPVTMVVATTSDNKGGSDSSGPQLIVSPSFLTFRPTGTSPQSMQLTLSARGGSIGAVSVSAKSDSGWLSASATGTGSTTVNVTATPGTLKPGLYTGSVTVGVAPAAGGPSSFPNSPVTVGATMLILGDITTSPVVLVTPTSVNLTATADGDATKAVSLDVFNPGGTSFTWTATASVASPSGGTWLQISPTSGNADTDIKVQGNPKGLAAGTYQGTVNITTSTGATAKVGVTFTVGAASSGRLQLDPQVLNFTYDPSSTTPISGRTLKVSNTGSGTLQWTATADAKWIGFSPSSGSTPGTITVTPNVTGLAAGQYSGNLTVTSGTLSNSTRVYLTVLGPSKPKVNVTPKVVTFSATSGVGSPSSRTLNISAPSGTGLTYTATAQGAGWFSVSPASGAVPGTITVTLNNSSLPSAPGIYTGSVQVKVPGAAQEQQDILVSLHVTSASDLPHLESDPGGLAFTAKVGGTAPASQSLSVRPDGASSLAVAVSTTVSSPTGGTWLSASPVSGSATSATPLAVTVSVKLTGLAAGTYSGAVVLTPASSSGAPPIQVPVKLVVAAGTSVAAESRAGIAAGSFTATFLEPANGFTHSSGQPMNVSVMVLDSSGAPVSGAEVVIDSSNSEPNLTLLDTGNGVYTAAFQPLDSGPISLAGSATLGTQTASPFAIAGNMEATAVAPSIIFQGGAVSAASFAPAPTPVAPGSLLSLFGRNIAGNGGSASGLPLPTSLGNVTVSIGGIPAPIVIGVPGAAGDQLNVQVPFELDGVAQADIVVNANGVLTLAQTVNLGAAPAFFTVSQNGLGDGAFLHGADYSNVNAAQPATAGETVLLYATGLGAVSPAGNTGAAADASNVTADVQVTIGGQAATVQYAGLAPGYVGLYQLNVIVPSGVTGSVPVVMTVGGTAATGQATIQVK